MMEFGLSASDPAEKIFDFLKQGLMPFYYSNPEALYFMQVNSDNFNGFLQDFGMLLNYVVVSDPGHTFISCFKRTRFVSAMLGFLCKSLSLPYYFIDILGNQNSGPLQNFNPKKLSQSQSLDLTGESAQREQLSGYRDTINKIVENF